jgi:hypothetical protein
MAKLFPAGLITFLLLAGHMIACGQTSAATGNSAHAALIKVLNRYAYFPRELCEKKQAAVFSLRITFNSQGKISKIEPSKYVPAKMIPELTAKENYNSVDWKELLKKDLKEGDALIIPFVAYDPGENNAVFYEYTMEDIFKFPAEEGALINCTVMQTYAIHYGSAMK